MHLEADGQPVRCGARQTRPAAQFRKAAWIFGHCLEHGHRLVQYSDSAMLSHKAILSSRSLGSPEYGKNELELRIDTGLPCPIGTVPRFDRVPFAPTNLLRGP